MAAVMMQAHGTETMIVKDGNKYSADFRYKNVDYEQDEYNGRCYFLDTSRSFTSQVAREGGLVRRRHTFPDMKNRWCTAYLKTAVTDKWIRQHRQQLGAKCLFVSGERRDESTGRAKLPELEYHSTTLKTKRVADFTCHWYRPCLDYEKGKMFEQGRELKLEPHPCYEYVGRCSCMFCMFMPERHAAENMKRYPEMAAEYVRAEMKIQHTWKKAKSLQSVFNECMDIDDVDGDIRQEFKQLSIFDEQKGQGNV